MCSPLCCQQRHHGWNSQNVCVKFITKRISNFITQFNICMLHSPALQLQLHSPLWTICPSTMTKKTSKWLPVLCIDMVITAKLHTLSPPDKIFGWTIDGSGTALWSNKMVFCFVLILNFLGCDNVQKEDKTYLVFILALTSKDSPNSHHLAPSPTTNKTSERQAF